MRWYLCVWLCVVCVRAFGTPVELQQNKALVEPGAGAEALSWDVAVTSEPSGNAFPHTVLTNHVRLRIFTAAGLSSGTVTLPFAADTTISEISARTTKPDGSTIELPPSAITTRSITRGDGLTLQAKTFTAPALAPGVTVDYQWKETRRGEFADHVRLPLQLAIPVRRVTYHILPVQTRGFHYPVELLSFHTDVGSAQAEGNGWYTFSARNVPAFREEPQMPPEHQVLQWVLLYYGAGKDFTEADYWKTVGRNFYQAWKSRIKIDDRVRRVASAAIEGATNNDEKISRLIDACRKHVRQVYSDQNAADDRMAMRGAPDTAAILAAGRGSAYQVNLVFAALATAAGYDARLSRVSDRSDIFFDTSLLSPYFLNYHQVAVKVNNRWQFYDPADRRLPSGMLRWQEEGVEALVTDPVESRFWATQVTPPDRSCITRTGQFTLRREGTLEGDVREVLSGQAGLDWRSHFASDAIAEREHELRGELQARFPEARISGARVSLPKNVSEGARFNYHVRIPKYARVEGRKIVLKPAYFEVGVAARFTAASRTQPIYFHYPWSEADSIRIKLPAGYGIDQAATPGKIEFAPSGTYSVRQYLSDDSFFYEREFSFGADGTLLFDASRYDFLKKLFDEVAKRDAESVSLIPYPGGSAGME